jgi:hypothetical protein
LEALQQPFSVYSKKHFRKIYDDFKAGLVGNQPSSSKQNQG